jgi:selenocysteine lyase/cysteine desulfurase
VGWFSHAEPFEMDIRSFRYAAGARRFWGGTPSVAPFVVAAAGFRALADVGIDAICAHNQQLLTRLFNGLPTGAVRSHGESGKRGSSAVIAVKNVGAASAALLQNAIAHDVRGGLRVSVHLYNNEEDVDALLGALKDWV